MMSSHDQKKMVDQLSLAGDVITQYPSLTAAAASVNVAKSTMSDAIKHFRTRKEHYWRYVHHNLLEGVERPDESEGGGAVGGSGRQEEIGGSGGEGNFESVLPSVLTPENLLKVLKEMMKKQGKESKLCDAAMLGMFVCVHTHVHTYHTHIHIHVQIQIHTCKFVYEYSYIHTYIHTYS